MENILLSDITLDGRQVDIFIDGGIIARIAPHEAGAVRDATGFEAVTCSGKVAMPGFVNMHTHAAMTLMRGIGEDMVLQDWLDHIWAIESRLDEAFVYWGTKVAALEMIKTGTTTFNDMYWFSPMARKAASEMGIRGAVSYHFLDGFDPEVAARQKDACIAMHQGAPGWDRSSIFVVSVHSVYTVSESLILWAAGYAREHGLRLHIHVSETEREVLECKEAHGGLSPVEYLDALGVLGPDTIAAHCLWLSEKDIEIMGRRHVSCVHNVNSNFKLSSGYKFRWKELAEAGANVCLGTDGCASSNNLDMLETMKTAAIAQKAWRADPTALTLNELLEMATVNGAKALGIRAGRVAEGYEADIQVVDTDSSFFLSPAPFLANYVYSAHSDCICSLIAGGRFVMRDRQVPGERDVLEGGRAELKTIGDY